MNTSGTSHVFTTDATRAASNGFSIKTWGGPFYALLFYVEGWTVPLYEMASPSSGTPVMAYGDTQRDSLVQAGYTVSRILFYIPAVAIQVAQTNLYLHWNSLSPTDSLLDLQNNITGYSMQQSVFNLKTCTSSFIATDCAYTAWSAWSRQCPVTCGGGELTRTRNVTLPAFGQLCSNVTVQYKTCNNYTCAELEEMFSKSGIDVFYLHFG